MIYPQENLMVLFFAGDNATKICSSLKSECYKNAAEILYGEDIVDGLEDNDAKLFRKNCNCLSSCTSISYEVIDHIQTLGQSHKLDKGSWFI